MIQMEYCDRDLSKFIGEGRLIDDVEEVWRLFRQILEALFLNAHHVCFM